MSTTQGIEVKKDGLSQLQDGSWVLKLKVHPADMPTTLMQASMGTRYIAALVEIGDDEQPVERPKERRPFDTLKRAQQAGILCNEGGFQKFLEHEKGVKFSKALPFDRQAATAVRKICGVNSRADLDTVPGAGEKWDRLEIDYRIWPGYEA